MIPAGCSGTDHPTEEVSNSAPVRVSAEEATTDTGTGTRVLVGTVKAVVTTPVSSQASGRVLSTRYEEGDRVAQGSVMAEIDQAQARSGLLQAEAALREAQMALREVESGRQAAVAGLNMAKANAALAAATFSRFQSLLERESVSRQEYEEVEARNLSAQAAVEQAEQSVLAMEDKKSQVEARIQQAEAGVEQASLNLGYASVTAPYDGIVVDKMVQTGQLASPGVPLYVVEKSDYELHVSIDVAGSRELEPGQEVPVSFDHQEGHLIGKVKEVLPVADPVSRTVLVKISLPANPGIYSGVFGRASFPAEGDASVSVPAASLVRRGQLTGVYVVGPDRTARYRLVRTGRSSASRVEILSGLNEGEAVITDPGMVSEGIGVEIN